MMINLNFQTVREIIEKNKMGLRRNKWQKQWRRSNICPRKHRRRKHQRWESSKRSRPNMWHCWPTSQSPREVSWSNIWTDSRIFHSTPSSRTLRTLHFFPFNFINFQVKSRVYIIIYLLKMRYIQILTLDKLDISYDLT